MCCSSTSTTRASPLRAAMYRGASPAVFLTRTSAPACRTRLAQAAWPPSHATNRGVAPPLSRAFIPLPSCSSPCKHHSGLGPPVSGDGSNDSSCAAYFSAVKKQCDRDLHKPERVTWRDTFRLKRCVKQATPIVATFNDVIDMGFNAQWSAPHLRSVGTQECLNLAYYFEGVLEGRYRYYTLEAVHEVHTLLCVYTQPKCRALYGASKPIPWRNGDLRRNSAECRPA